MTARSDSPMSRQRGSIRRRARCYEVRVSAGEDPSTRERIVLVDSVEIEGQGERAERAAYREAEKFRTKLLADADALKVARTKATVGALLERWMAQHEIDPTTRMTYESQIRMYIVPAVGDVPLVLFVRDASQRLETLYSRLRQCRALCHGAVHRAARRDGRPARLHRRQVQAARLQALRSLKRALDPCHPVRRL
jgi:integrase